jgi:hypothetical protein
MNDAFDLNTMIVRTVLFIAVAALFYFVLKSKKSDKE